METKTDVKAKSTKPKKLSHDFYDWIESGLVGFILVIAILAFAVRGTVVDGDSMVPTLEHRQFLVLSRFYNSLNHNDIVVIYAKDIDSGNGEKGRPIIKRVIGLPGDVISIDTESGTVIRNGEELPIEVAGGVIYEDGHIINELTRAKFDMPEGAQWIVPPYCVFVMGDNRNISKDSRSNEVGMVNENYVIGRVLFRITPLDKFGKVE